jgi:hypothetical protein
MVEYDDMTPEEKHAYRVKFREEKAKREQEEAATKAAVKEEHKETIVKKKGFLERVADKAEHARSKYDNIKTQGGRIKNAISPAVKKPKAKGRMPAQLKPYAYRPKHTRRLRQPSYQPRQRNDAYNDLINGQPSQGRGGSMYNDLIHGQQSHKSSAGFFDEMLNGSSKKGKRKGGDPFKDLLG